MLGALETKVALFFKTNSPQIYADIRRSKIRSAIICGDLRQDGFLRPGRRDQKFIVTIEYGAALT
jgi:hypothetical protein